MREQEEQWRRVHLQREDGRWVGKYTVNGNRKCVYGTILLEIIASSLRLLKAL
jgi:hypothetical protein